MRRLILLVVAIVLASMPLAGQQPRLPADVCATLTQQRKAYPTPISSAQLGELLNSVAYVYRLTTLGLGGKTSGTRCPSLAGSIACDLLYRKSDGVGWDVIRDVEGPAAVQCGSGFLVTNRPWVAPVDPGGTVPTPPPATCDCPPASSHPVSSQQFALQSARIDAAERAVQALEQRVRELETQINALLLAEYEVDFGSGRTLGHTHSVKGPVRRVQP